MLKSKRNRTLILAVSHCLINPKVRANGLSQHPETKKKILKLAQKYNAEIRQLPCPEFLFLGKREPKTYDEYMEIMACPTTCPPRSGRRGFGRLSFKDFCEKLAEDFVANLKNIHKCQLIVVGIARSPSCSISYVHDRNNKLKKGEGIFMHFLRKKNPDLAVLLEIDYHKIDVSLEKIKAVLEATF